MAIGVDRLSHPEGEYRPGRGQIAKAEHHPVKAKGELEKGEQPKSKADYIRRIYGKPVVSALNPETGRYYYQDLGALLNPASRSFSLLNPTLQKILDVAKAYDPSTIYSADASEDDKQLATKKYWTTLHNMFPELDAWKSKFEGNPEEALKEAGELYKLGDIKNPDNIDFLSNLGSLAMLLTNSPFKEYSDWTQSIRNNPDLYELKGNDLAKSLSLLRRTMQAAPMTGEDGVQLTDENGKPLWNPDLSLATPVVDSDEYIPINLPEDITPEDAAKYFAGGLGPEGYTVPSSYMNIPASTGLNFDPGTGPISSIANDYRKSRTIGDALSLADLINSYDKKDYDDVQKQLEQIKDYGDMVQPSTVYNALLQELMADKKGMYGKGSMFQPILNILRGRSKRAKSGKMYSDEPAWDPSLEGAAIRQFGEEYADAEKDPANSMYTLDMLKGFPLTGTGQYPKFRNLMDRMARSRLNTIDNSQIKSGVLRDTQKQIDKLQREIEEAEKSGDVDKANKKKDILQKKQAKLAEFQGKDDFTDTDPFVSPFSYSLPSYPNVSETLRNAIDEMGQDKFVEEMWKDGEDKVDENVNEFIRQHYPNTSTLLSLPKDIVSMGDMLKEARREVGYNNDEERLLNSDWRVKGGKEKYDVIKGAPTVGEASQREKGISELISKLYGENGGVEDEQELNDILDIVKDQYERLMPEMEYRHGGVEGAEKYIEDTLKDLRSAGMATLSAGPKQISKKESKPTTIGGSEQEAGALVGVSDEDTPEEIAKREADEAMSKRLSEIETLQAPLKKRLQEGMQKTKEGLEKPKLTTSDKEQAEESVKKENADRRQRSLLQRMRDIRGKTFQQTSTPSETSKKDKEGNEVILRKGTSDVSLTTAESKQQQEEADRAEKEAKVQKEQADRAEKEAQKQQEQAEQAKKEEEAKAFASRIGQNMGKGQKRKLVVKVKKDDTGDRGISSNIADTIADMARGY